MINVLKIIIKSLKVISKVIFLPIMDLFETITLFFNLELEKIKIDTFLKETLKKYVNIAIVVYYIFLFLVEFYLLFKIIEGDIIYYEFNTLCNITIIILLYSIILVNFLNKRFKSKKFNYVIYFQILFLLPMIMVYWIANIEGHSLSLKLLTAEQWISLFNTIIIYISGCFIGLITLYKNENKN